jgi:hypothetical protein
MRFCLPAVCLLPFAYCFSARVAQLTERWSYKPEVEGLSPSLGTTSQNAVSRRQKENGEFCCSLLTAYCLLFSGRDSSRQNGDCQGAWSSQRRDRPHAPALLIADCGIRIADRKQVSKIRILHSTIRNSDGPRSRHRSSKPNLQELGGKARGSTPPRASKISFKFQVPSSKFQVSTRNVKPIHGCVAQVE